jgi:glutamate-1-semialdehyde 2,1-aminomutase
LNTQALTDGLLDAARKAGVPFSTNRAGGMFGIFFNADKVETFVQAMACDRVAFNRFFHAMLDRGVYFAPSAFEAGFMSTAHGDDVIAATLEAARAGFAAAAQA